MARHVLYWLPSLGLMAVLTWLSHQQQWPEAARGFPDWLLHGSAYALLGAFNCLGLTVGNTRRLGTRGGVLALLGASIFGLFDEFHQGFIPGRDMSILDWLADTVGAAVSVLVLRLRAG